jgi:hypothetical protein
MDPTRFMLIRKMNRFPICFMISLLGSWTSVLVKGYAKAEASGLMWPSR